MGRVGKPLPPTAAL